MSQYIPAQHVASLDAVPLSQRPLFQRTNGGGYSLHAGGVVLARLRSKLRETGSLLPPSPDGKLPTIAAKDWIATLAAATPFERRAMQEAAARRELSIAGA